jgi:glycerophosphoryl diester phosphodiesterase
VIDLRRRDGARPLRVGHRENTLESLESAAGHGVDVVELDVLDTRDGALVLAHSDDLHEVSQGLAAGRVRTLTLEQLRNVAPKLPTLDEALELLGHRVPDLGIQLDLKWIGYEEAAVEALRRHGVLERAFVSSFHGSSLHALAALEPRLPLAVTYPQDRYGLSGRRVLVPAVLSALLVMRQSLPYRIDAWLRRSHASAATLHWAVVSPAAIERCHARGAAVLAWTVDDPKVCRRLTKAGIDGIITNDPRIFDGDAPLTT